MTIIMTTTIIMIDQQMFKGHWLLMMQAISTEYLIKTLRRCYFVEHLLVDDVDVKNFLKKSAFKEDH